MNLLKMKIAQKLPLVLIGSAMVVGIGIGVAAYMIGRGEDPPRGRQRIQ